MLAKVVRLNETVEEEVILNVCGQELLCFASVCAYPIREGGAYNISFSPQVFNEHDVIEAKIHEKKISKLDDSYSYLLRGYLEGNVLDVGILRFEDDYFYEVPDLNGKWVETVIDRLDVTFE